MNVTNNEGAGQMSERVDLDGIEARANAATPGPWRRDTHYGYKIVTDSKQYDDPEHERLADAGAYTRHQTVGHVNPPDAYRPARLRAIFESGNAANSDYIAGMDPATTLALVAEVRALRTKVEAVEVMADEIEVGDWGYEWRQNNVHGAIRAALRDGEAQA